MFDYKARAIREGQGFLFTNNDKVDERSPDLRGEVFVNGEILRCAAWIKETDQGMVISIGFDKYAKRKNANG